MKAVLFDLFGVLVVNKKYTLNHFLKKLFKTDKSLEDIAKIRKPLYKLVSAGKISRKQFWKLLCSKFSRVDSIEAKCLKKIMPKLKEKYVHSLVKKIGKHYKVAVVSNHVDFWARSWLDKLKLTKLFDVIVISSTVKARKPRKEPYLAAARRLGVKPKECYYIGDEDTDIEGAKKLGMKTIFIPGESKSADADFTIKRLKELLNILKV